jgi:uncharacterized membrane protein
MRLNIKDIQEAIKKALLSAGMKIYKIFLIYLGINLVLNLMIIFLLKPITQYSLTVYEYYVNGNSDIPAMESSLYISFMLILIILLTVRVVTLGWDRVCLKVSRGETEITFHDLTSMFPQVWKIALMLIIEAILTYIGLLLFIIPGLFLLLRWSMAFYVLIEHPEYGPVRCLKQGARLMVGEIKNLLKLGAVFFTQYLFAGLIWYFSRELINLFKAPPVGIGYSVFYNRLVYWKPEDKPNEQ